MGRTGLHWTLPCRAALLRVSDPPPSDSKVWLETSEAMLEGFLRLCTYTLFMRLKKRNGMQFQD